MRVADVGKVVVAEWSLMRTPDPLPSPVMSRSEVNNVAHAACEKAGPRDTGRPIVGLLTLES